MMMKLIRVIRLMRLFLIDVQKVNSITRFQVDSLSLPEVMEYHKSLLINMMLFSN